MIAAYGVYAASATGGNDLARDFLAGIAALYAHPFYKNIGSEERHLVYPSTILACLAVVVIIPVYVIYWKGPTIRMKSPFAQELEKGRRARLQKSGRRSTVGMQGGLEGGELKGKGSVAEGAREGMEKRVEEV